MEEDRLYDLYAIEEDIKILNKIIVTLDNHHLGGGQAIEHLIEAYRKVKKQNKKMEELIENSECDMCTNFVRKSKIKEKIEELLEKGKQMSEKERQEETQFMQGKLKALEELLEEDK